MRARTISVRVRACELFCVVLKGQSRADKKVIARQEQDVIGAERDRARFVAEHEPNHL